MAVASMSRPPARTIDGAPKSDTPLRVLLIINNLIYGGAETQVIALSRGLASRGHEVMLHTLRSDNPRVGDLTGSGVRVVAARKRWRFDPTLVMAIRAKIAAFRPDVIHGFLPEGNLYARLAGLRTGIPALNSERNDNYTLPWKYRAAMKLTRGMVSGVVANSHSGARFARKLFELPSDRVDVVWNGLDVTDLEAKAAAGGIDPRREFFPTPPARLATLVGAMRPQKDHVMALRVAEALHRLDARWRVLFVGDCLPHTRDYAEQVKRRWRDMGLENVVAFAGVRSDAVEIVRQSSVLFSTSLFEGCPNVVLEAMTVGTPVVSMEYSDIRMILPRAWQVVAERDPAEMARAIVRADRERDELVALQRQWIDANGTLGAAVDRLEAVYRRYALPRAPRGRAGDQQHRGLMCEY